MKKYLSFVVVLLVFVTLCLCGCSSNYVEKTSKSADNYTISLGYDGDSHTLSALQTFSYTNRTENTFNCLKFHVYPNAYREDAKMPVVSKLYEQKAYPSGKSYGDVSFDSVKVDGNAVAFVIEGSDADILTVPLEKELFPNESTTVEMVYEVHLANVCHRLGYTENTVNLGNFYPVLCNVKNGEFVTSPYYNVGDPFVSQVANFEVNITVPSSFVVASTGVLQSVTASENTSTYNYQAQAVRDFAFVMSQKFQKVSATVDKTTVNYYYFADGDANASLENAVSALKFMNKNVAEYPYSVYNVCETDFCYGGMEYPCLSMVTSGSEAYGEAILHETAHQWFYGLVGNDQIENAWMDEGLAEFLTMLMLDENGTTPLATSVKSAFKTFTTYVDVLNHYYQTSDTSLRPVYNYKNDSEYVCMTYVKGSLMFNTLYEAMGKQKFFKALSTYFDTAKMTVAEPSAMIECFNKASGSNATGIFETFIAGKEVIGEFRG